VTGGGVPGRRPAEHGSAVVEFVLVGGLVVLLVVAVLQLALVLHVRNTLVDAAAQGARYAALAGHRPEEGRDRTCALVTAELSPAYAADVTVGRTRLDGLDLVEVRVDAPLPVVGLLGPGGVLSVRGHAPVEPP